MEKSKAEQRSASDEDIPLPYPYELQNKEANENFEKTLTEVEKRFNELLSTINEETIQLSELLVEEKKLIQELCTLLRNILTRLDMTFDLSLRTIPELQPKAKKIVLNKEGSLILTYEKEKVSRVLENYPPQIVLSVIWNVIPELEKSIRAYRRKIIERVSMLERIKKELKNIQKIFSSSNKDESQVFIVGKEELKDHIAANDDQHMHAERNE